MLASLFFDKGTTNVRKRKREPSREAKYAWSRSPERHVYRRFLYPDAAPGKDDHVAKAEAAIKTLQRPPYEAATGKPIPKITWDSLRTPFASVYCKKEEGTGSKCMHSASDLAKLIRDQVRINPYCSSTELMCTIKQRLEDRKDCDDRTLWYYHNRYGNETVQKQVRRAKKLVTREIWGDSTILKYLKFLDEYVKLSDVDNE